MTKVVGVGLNKTGTKTLGHCLDHFGYRHRTFDPQAMRRLMAGEKGAVIEQLSHYDSFEDWPWPLLYQEIDELYPGSKFILTERASPEIWFRSLCGKAERGGPSAMRHFVYGYAMPHAYQTEHIRIYNEHNQAVRNHFKARSEQLLVVCWEEGAGWEELAKFLERPIPKIPFPHRNKRPAGTGWLKYYWRRVAGKRLR